MSDLADSLSRLDALDESEFVQLEHLILRTYSAETKRRESIAAAVTCANLVASTEIARIRVGRILRLLELVGERAESDRVVQQGPVLRPGP